jgi:hypothetical protein
MPAALIFLTPILVLAIVALLGFVGCDRVLGLTHFPQTGPISRVYQVAGNQASGKGPFTVTYSPASASVQFAVVISMHWGDSGGATAQVAVNGATQQAIQTDTFDPQAVAHFVVNNVNADSMGMITVSVGLSSNSATAWDYCVSIYNNVNQTNPYGSNAARQGTTQGSIPDTANAISITSSANDLIYSVAVSQTTGGFLGGTVSANAPFTQVENPVSYFLVEDLQVDNNTAQPVSPTATVSGAAKWYFFAMLLEAT